MQQLGVLAKYWQPGQVKTRLALTIGPERAAQVHRACLATLLERFAATADRRVLLYTPDLQVAEFGELATAAWELVPQGAGDLGSRLEFAFREAFAHGAERVVLLGADSPNLPRAIVDEAFDRLQRDKVVLGPSDDGGYYLIGAREVVPPCLHEVDWGTPLVWSQTADRLRAAGCEFAELPPWFDVDEAEDLARLRGELAETGAGETELFRLRAELQAILEP